MVLTLRWRLCVRQYNFKKKRWYVPTPNIVFKRSFFSSSMACHLQVRKIFLEQNSREGTVKSLKIISIFWVSSKLPEMKKKSFTKNYQKDCRKRLKMFETLFSASLLYSLEIFHLIFLTYLFNQTSCSQSASLSDKYNPVKHNSDSWSLPSKVLQGREFYRLN